MSNAPGLVAATQENNQLAPSAGTSVEQSRAMQEVQGAIFMAKQFPRDVNAAWTRVMNDCRRQGLAEVAKYVFPRGGTSVEGPSVHLARSVAKNWGNIQTATVELEQNTDEGYSEVLSYAWDLETNVRFVKQFRVPHFRYTKSRGNVRLTDPRDIYEHIANNGARRERACILNVVPADVVDAAMAECEKTLRGESKEPLEDRVRKAADAFAAFGVTQAMIEKKLGHKMEATSQQELINLQKIYRSLKDGMGKREDYFEVPNLADAEVVQEGGQPDMEALAASAKAQDAQENVA